MPQLIVKRRRREDRCDEISIAEDKRSEADNVAERIIRAGVVVNGDVVTKLMRMWGFQRNVKRQYVIPKGKKWVQSDTLGLVVVGGQ